PDDAVLLLVLDDRALQRGGQVLRADLTAPEVAGQRHAAGEHGDRLCRREHAARRLELGLAVQRLPGAQLTEDGDDLFDRLRGGNLRLQLEVARQVAHAPGYNVDLALDGLRRRQHDNVEAALQR